MRFCLLYKPFLQVLKYNLMLSQANSKDLLSIRPIVKYALRQSSASYEHLFNDRLFIHDLR